MTANPNANRAMDALGTPGRAAAWASVEAGARIASPDHRGFSSASRRGEQQTKRRENGVAAERRHAQRFAERAALVALSVVLALVTLTSTLTVAVLHDHDCSGDDCPICLVISAAQSILGNAATPASGAAAYLFALACAFVAACGQTPHRVADTPVTQGVKLLI